MDLWQFAEETITVIHNALNQEMYIKQGLAIMNAFSGEELYNELYSSSHPGTIIRLSPCNVLSNLGLFDFGQKQHYQYDVRECLFTRVVGKFASTFIHTITTVNDKLSWIISNSKSRVEED